MLQGVDIRNTQNQLLGLPLWDASSGYSVRNIDGLDPVKALVSTSSFASMDGEQYQASRREKRNILIQLGMEPGYSSLSVRELRTQLYYFFMPKSQASCLFYEDTGEKFLIDARIESFDAPLFAKEPIATISLLCFDPDFRAPEDIVIAGNSVNTAIDTPLEYLGSSPTGLVFELNINRTLSEVTFQQVAGDNFLRSQTITYDFLTGDKLQISTIPGKKSVKLIRAGLETSILYAMSTASSWPMLQPGENMIRVFAEGAAIPYTITYTPRFGGL